MTNQGISKVAFGTLDRLTDRYPSIVPSVAQKILLSLAGNNLVYSLFQLKYKRELRRIKSFERILLVADVNIGDAITIQQCVTVFRHYFPASTIDYACNQTGAELVRGMPQADNVFGVFNSSGGFPGEEDLQVLEDIVRGNDYSVIVCFSPFVPKNRFRKLSQIVEMYVPLASYIFRRWKTNDGRRHLSEAVFTVTMNLLESVNSHRRKDAGHPRAETTLRFEGNSIYLTPSCIHRAQRFLIDHNLSSEQRLLFFNPDATSQYSQIPPGVQKQILRMALESASLDAVLLACGRSSEGIENLLTAGLPNSLRNKLVIVPRLPINVYAALIDACDMFLSGDTGPAHIAASRKVALSEYGPVRNRTSVVTVFGAGDSRMYGYDSGRNDHLAASQQAPSKIFAGAAPCRNITCVNKWGKSCSEIRCFHGLLPHEISSYVVQYFDAIRKREQVVLGKAV